LSISITPSVVPGARSRRRRACRSARRLRTAMEALGSDALRTARSLRFRLGARGASPSGERARARLRGFGVLSSSSSSICIPTRTSSSTSIASASASPNRPSSTKGSPSALTICALPVISAPGAICCCCPAAAAARDGMCAACSTGGIEKKGILWWFQSMRTWRAAASMSGVPPCKVVRQLVVCVCVWARGKWGTCFEETACV